MAAARYSQDVLEEFFGEIPRRESEPEEEEKDILNLDEAIQNLPPELREKIYKELVAIKIRERNEMGWNEVHEDIEEPKDIMDLYLAKLKDLLDYNQVDVKTRERIYEEFNEIKRAERKEMGWNELHYYIEEAPFCEKLQRITKVCYCRKCTSCRINGLCYECFKKGENQYLDFPYNENFQKFY